MPRALSESGEILLDKLPVPKNRESRPRLDTQPPRRPVDKRVWLVGVPAIAGLIAGFVLRPMVAPDPRIAEAKRAVTESAADVAAANAKLDQMTKAAADAKSEREKVDVKLKVAQQAQAQLAGQADEEEAKAKTTEGVRAKLAAAVEKTAGAATADGPAVTLELSDKVLFKPGDDAITDRGKKVLDKVASVLKELPDRDVIVQGHTDATPIFNAPPVSPPKPGKVKGGKTTTPDATVEAAPAVRFKTNWELSAARALAVVHYLQDVHKLEGARLSAIAFGQYQPVSASSSETANRRLEIVVYPRASSRW